MTTLLEDHDYVNRAGAAEGWGLFNVGTPDVHIEREDETDRFVSDEEAIAYVRTLANTGSSLHALALRMAGLS